METYIIRVNGREYVVEVEKATGAEGIGTGSAAGQAQPVMQTVQPSPAPQTAQSGQTSQTQAASAQAQGEAVTTGTAGKVWKITGKVGDTVKRGDTILILEAMKMEIPVVAPVDGTIGSISVSEGDSVKTGQTVATVQ